MTELDRREWGDEPAFEEPTFEELYDEMTLRRLGLEPDPRPAAPPGDDAELVADHATAVDPGAEPDPGADAARELELAGDAPARHPVRRRMAGAVLAGAMLGLGEVLEPEKPKEAVVEPELLGEPPIDQPVQFIMVPGLPKASVVILRPWLRRRVRGPEPPAGPAADIPRIGL